ncbi:MAG: S1C family serine protease [Patescibacteria group bacterium]|nr:S1C family serine protease [Patescibacteria group bacterium]
MEHLTKHQIVLVALLVAFVTSITTGIVTVSLVDQSTPSVPQVVNRVVERTIEKVVPNTQSAAVVTKETIVVRSEDQAIEAINKNSDSVVRIYSTNSTTSSTTPDSFLGLGVFVTKDGKIIADKDVVSAQGNYVALVSGGKNYPLQLQKTSDEGLALFSITSTGPFVPVILSKIPAHLGQSVLSLGGKITMNVAMGIVSEVIGDDNATTTDKTASAIKTDIDSRSSLNGSPLINLSGEVVGLKITKLNSDNEIKSFYLPSAIIANLLTDSINK